MIIIGKGRAVRAVFRPCCHHICGDDGGASACRARSSAKFCGALDQLRMALIVSAVSKRVNLAALFAGQMEIAFGHFSSVRCAVPRKHSLHVRFGGADRRKTDTRAVESPIRSASDRQKNRHTQHGKVWREKTSGSRGARCARIVFGD